VQAKKCLTKLRNRSVSLNDDIQSFTPLLLPKKILDNDRQAMQVSRTSHLSIGNKAKQSQANREIHFHILVPGYFIFSEYFDNPKLCGEKN
jgi:hypothetical protein